MRCFVTVAPYPVGVVLVVLMVVTSCANPVVDYLGALGSHRTTLTRLGDGCDILLSGTPAFEHATVHGFHYGAQALAL